jgi:hypothetical protein
LRKKGSENFEANKQKNISENRTPYTEIHENIKGKNLRIVYFTLCSTGA